MGIMDLTVHRCDQELEGRKREEIIMNWALTKCQVLYLI